MLQLRPNCECCDKDLPPESKEAVMCSFECTFCTACADAVLRGTCPNCGGELVRRPTRSAKMLVKSPASTERVVKSDGCRTVSARKLSLGALPLAWLLILGACAARSTDTAALDQFQGTWYSVSTESDGQQQTGEDKADLHVIAGNHCTVQFGGKTVGESTITLAPGEKTGKITFRMTAGQYTNRTWVGIYRADGDTLAWNGGWTTEVATVPSTFATAPGDHYFHRTVRRARP